VRELRRTPSGWELVAGPTNRPSVLRADGVVLAVPATPAGRLLAEVSSTAARDVSAIPYASVAIVTLAYPAGAFPEPLAGSGFLVPPVERRLVKAATFSSQKWGWYADAAPGLALVRLSMGRHGEEAVLHRDDAELATAAAAELAEALPVHGRPVDVRVTRWGGSLPQYAPGHLARVARIRAALGAPAGARRGRRGVRRRRHPGVHRVRARCGRSGARRPRPQARMTACPKHPMPLQHPAARKQLLRRDPRLATSTR
jgi:oxygen-dependent protoporphyrinogen oxidase